jgi:hypothetical protein
MHKSIRDAIQGSGSFKVKTKSGDVLHGHKKAIDGSRKYSADFTDGTSAKSPVITASIMGIHTVTAEPGKVLTGTDRKVADVLAGILDGTISAKIINK